LQIGQAGEFDYSGSQAIKALKEENIKTVLVNPNIATIQTSPEMADRLYLVALTPEFVEQVIEREEVDAILLSFGGQTALNCGLALHRTGVLARHGVRVLGTPIEAIENTEDRKLFVEKLDEIGVRSPKGVACHSVAEARDAAQTLGFPVILRGAYALGGKGSDIVRQPGDLERAVRRAFDSGLQQVLVEEYLDGWKEIEYEVVRDGRDNTIAVCNMENFDPMGIHTGDSIVVAPSQTLTNDDHQTLRSLALEVVRHIGIVGECNIQYALDPATGDYRVIEVNARLSRSSALASKATGYPLAYVAAKLAIGYSLPEIPNAVTGCTSAFFEPALDYLVCKIPRWDMVKFQGASSSIGTEMKSVGEVMALGRSFPEVLQKALRMLDIGVTGLDPEAFQFRDIQAEIKRATTHRVFAIARALCEGTSVDEVHELSGIDRWFLDGIAAVMAERERLRALPGPIDESGLRQAKQLGFSDEAIEHLTQCPPGSVREARGLWGIQPQIASIDTTAAEFPAATSYLYSSYLAADSEVPHSRRPKILVLGSGPYRIGSSVEFDWCCVNAIRAASELGYETIMLNCNPETVSTDYDVCDQLIFDEISLESVLEICARQQPDGVVISMGGQVPNNLAMKLHAAGVPILGTAAEDIDRAEDRSKFSDLLDRLGIDQPVWEPLTELSDAAALVERLGGYPVLVRPSYVLSGAAMSVAHEPHELTRILQRASDVSREHPVVVSKFEAHAKEIEIDAVADRGELVNWAISEHIEHAGVHSGDATLVLPPQTLYIATIRQVRRIAAAVARELSITGPFNMQFLAKLNMVKVIECNLRASRSFPFVSKATGGNFAAEAMRRMLGVRQPVVNNSLDLDYVAVKAPQFSFDRLIGADPMLGVEMASTGEVGCFGDDLYEALIHAMFATGFTCPTKGVLFSLGPIEEKYALVEEVRAIGEELGLPVFATEGTAEALEQIGIACHRVSKHLSEEPNAMSLIDDGRIDLVVNIPREYDRLGRPDGYLIRRRAVEAGVPLITDFQSARAMVAALRAYKKSPPKVLAWQDYVTRDARPLQR
jgi:carbamoyl-phosphate synthase large subunit